MATAPAWYVERARGAVMWPSTLVLNAIADPRVVRWSVSASSTTATGLDAAGAEIERWETADEVRATCRFRTEHGDLLLSASGFGVAPGSRACAQTADRRVVVRVRPARFPATSSAVAVGGSEAR